MDYAVVRRLARGGMGVVDLAVASDGASVALKRIVLHGSVEEVALARRRILREAQLMRSLDHPHVLRLLDALEEGGDIVLVFPYLPGGSLSERVSREGPLDPSVVEGLLPPLLDALATIHRGGVVHRDVKPANLLFDEGGRLLLADFGIATARELTVGLTRPGQVMGTLGFMAPEVARGGAATPAADVFGLGASMLFALTGHGPYGTSDPAALAALAAGGKVAPLPRGLPTEIAASLKRMLEADPARRPTAAALAGGPHGTARMRPPDRRRSSRGRLLPLGFLAAGGLLATTLVVAGALRSEEHLPLLEEAPCEPLPYRPCDGENAPFTNGVDCVAEHADYDGVSENGCEAAPDDRDGALIDLDAGTVEVEGESQEGDLIEANLVPAEDSDSYSVASADAFHILCDGAIVVRFTAAADTSQRITVSDSGGLLEEAQSSDGEVVELLLREPNCMADDSGVLTIQVDSVDDRRSEASYLLELDGGF